MSTRGQNYLWLILPLEKGGLRGLSFSSKDVGSFSVVEGLSLNSHYPDGQVGQDAQPTTGDRRQPSPRMLGAFVKGDFNASSNIFAREVKDAVRQDDDSNQLKSMIRFNRLYMN